MTRETVRKSVVAIDAVKLTSKFEPQRLENDE